jgi:AcrR family transcriptional regulator
LSEAEEAVMRGRIVATARQLFAERGFEAVSLRNIAGGVGCSPMWLYRYYGGKNAILRTIWEEFFAEVFARLEKVRDPDPLRLIEKLALGYLDYWFEHPDRFRMVFLNEDTAASEGDLYVNSSAIVARFQVFLRPILAAQAAGTIRAGDPMPILEGFGCLLHGLALNLITISEYPWTPRAQLAPMLIKSYLDGLRPGRPGRKLQ